MLKNLIKSISIKDLIYIGIILIVCLFMLHECGEKNKQKELNAYNEQVHQSDLKSYIDKYNREVILRENIVLNSSKDLKVALSVNDKLKESLNKFKKVNTVTQIKTITKIEKDTIEIKDTIFQKDFDSLKIKKITSNYSLLATLRSKHLTIDSLVIPNIQTAVIGSYKSSFFGKSRLTTSVTNSNPLMQTVDLSTLQVEVPKKWYEKPFLPLAIGLVGGILITK